MRTLLILIILLFPNVSMSNNIYKKIEILSVEIEKEVIKWRHHIHKNPELAYDYTTKGRSE